MTHGCCSNKAIIRGESQEEFDEVLADWIDDYRPGCKSDRLLVEAAVLAQWLQMRNTNRYNELEQKFQEKSALEWTEEEHGEMERCTRYKTTAERSFVRAANTVEQIVKRRRNRSQERASEREKAAETKVADKKVPEAKVAKETVAELQRADTVEERKPKPIHVLDQWVDVVMEDGRVVTTLEPSNEQLIEDCGMMEPPPEQVCRRFHFHDGIPDEYSWACETEDQHIITKSGLQQMSMETWLAAIEREQAASTGHLSDTGEDLPDPQRLGCWCVVCARNVETARRRATEAAAERNQPK
jgi:flagellar biosynthesis GTPase FlhF